jgi:hypothetical protein
MPRQRLRRLRMDAPSRKVAHERVPQAVKIDYTSGVVPVTQKVAFRPFRAFLFVVGILKPSVTRRV